MNYPLPKETKFSQFLRRGGKSEFVLRIHPRRYERKSYLDFEAIVQQYHEALQAESSQILARIEEIFQQYAPDVNIDFDASEAIEVERAAFKDALEIDPSQANHISSWVSRFGAALNREQQVALGGTHYIWRSKDDDKVRSRHADYDDQIFSWNEPPEGGHPGEAYNCRCFAEPFLAEGQFQTRDENSVFENVGGEFVCEEPLICANIDPEILGPGDWTSKDRIDQSQRWIEANKYNLTQVDGYLKYQSEDDRNTLAIRAALYHWVQYELSQKGHEVRWPGAAGDAVEAAWYLYKLEKDDPDMVGMIMGANDAIIEDVWSKLRILANQEEILTGEAAKEWDMQMLADEQNLVQPIYERYADTEAMANYEANAKREEWLSFFGGFMFLPKFEGDLKSPIDRWVFGMNAMGYENVDASQMPD